MAKDVARDCQKKRSPESSSLPLLIFQMDAYFATLHTRRTERVRREIWNELEHASHKTMAGVRAAAFHRGRLHAILKREEKRFTHSHDANTLKDVLTRIGYVLILRDQASLFRIILNMIIRHNVSLKLKLALQKGLPIRFASMCSFISPQSSFPYLLVALEFVAGVRAPDAECVCW